LIHGGSEEMVVLQLAATCVGSIQNSVEIGVRYIFESAIDKKGVMGVVNIAMLIMAIAGQADQHERKSHRVLIIDDEPRLTKILKRCLEKRTGHVVKVENNSCKALKLAHEPKPELALLDLYMQGLSGEGLAKEIIKDPKLSNLYFRDFAQPNFFMKLGVNLA
jgi:hypothetical protein